MFTDLDRKLCRALCDHPGRHNNDYTAEAKTNLLETLFRALTNDRAEYLHELFPFGFPPSYKLQDRLQHEQSAKEDVEYTSAAKGHPCGHIFRQGEASYHCMTCTDDPTCVLCARCFSSSDHEGHQFHISVSAGNSGCCDCGDDEAWKKPVRCAIHTNTGERVQEKGRNFSVPPDLRESIKITIGRALDYFCDVISCSPENLRVPKTSDTIRTDEKESKLGDKYYGPGDEVEANPKFSLVLWNDEKHTIRDVQHQLARACKERERFGLAKASEAHDIGRSVVRHSHNVDDLIRIAKVIEQTKLTVTIRSSRDTFREQMCDTIVEWLSDIAKCSVGDDHLILRRTICEEMLQQWRVGSNAHNAQIGINGIDDHEKEERPRQRGLIFIPADDVGEFIDAEEFEDEVVARALDMAVEDVEQQNAELEAEGDRQDAAEDDEDEDEYEHLDGADFSQEDRDGTDHMEVDVEVTEEGGDQNLLENDGMDTDTDGLNDTDIPRGFQQPQTRMGVPTEQDIRAPRITLDVTQRRAPTRAQTDSEAGRRRSGFEPAAQSSAPDDQTKNFMNVPKTPNLKLSKKQFLPPDHWAVLPQEYSTKRDLPFYEDLTRNIRLDSMILFDLRLWKKTRISLRDLYISTVVKIPEFKRLLGLRFAGLYTSLAQLYLVADREPDHSIINLSLQMLTSPSITQEVIERGNFLTNLMAILYTFLATRQVGFPKDVLPLATLAFETGTVANRRLFHFFQDLRYFLSSDYVKKQVRTEKQYLFQFLDLAKLSQGICPNVRAVGEHVEYETDAWIGASLLTREVNKLCRQFAECYLHKGDEISTDDSVFQAIYHTSCTVILNSLGLERKRFHQSEIKELVRHKSVQYNFLMINYDNSNEETFQETYNVVDFSIETGSMSFHHALHYTLSWLVECGKNSPVAIQSIRDAAQKVYSDIIDRTPKSVFPSETYEDALMAMFDYPIRVCAWLAQVKVGLWVRNGMSLRHQMIQYKGALHRDVGHHRDLVLLQAALVTCDPSRLLAAMIDRYGLEEWIRWVNYGEIDTGVEYPSSEQVDICEDLVYLLINLLSDRDALVPLEEGEDPQMAAVRKDIVHTLCFKPLSFTELSARLTERANDYQQLQEVLDSMTIFRPPEGLHDSGLFELKPEYLRELDPYNSHFSKNQREEAENIYRTWMAKQTKKPAADIVLEPKLRPIRSGAFVGLGNVTRTPLFMSFVHHCLLYSTTFKELTPDIPITRVESFLHVALQLILIAATEDDASENSGNGHNESFIRNCLTFHTAELSAYGPSFIKAIHAVSETKEYASCEAKVKHIMRLFAQKQGKLFERATADISFPYARLDTASDTNSEAELEAKKMQAVHRKARILAQFQQQQQNFMDSQGVEDWDDDDFNDVGADAQMSPFKTWKYPAGACIQCKDETNDSRLYGSFAMIAESNILRQTDFSNLDFIREVLDTPQSLDRLVNREQPFGVSGANHETILRLTSDGTELVIDRQGLGKGWPIGSTKRAPISTSCGHIMHFACFENYYNSVARRQSHQIARNHPERLSLKEFVCPLCKAMGNAFIPIIWKPVDETSVQTILPGQDLDHFLEITLPPRLEQQRVALANNESLAPTVHLETLTRFAKGGLAPVVALWQRGESPISPTGQSWINRPEMSSYSELARIYARLRETLNVVRQNTSGGSSLSSEVFDHFDLLIQTLANSISATEMGYRGIEAEPGCTLLSKIPQQTITHLRIMSSTSTSYAAAGAMTMKAGSGTDFNHCQRRLFEQLFYAYTQHSIPSTNPMPFLGVDSFAFLTETSLVLAPTLMLDLHHILQLCYISEIIRCLLTCMDFRGSSDGFLGLSPQNLSFSNDSSRPSSDTLIQAARAMYEWVANAICLKAPKLRKDIRPCAELPNEWFLTFLALLNKYALAFLRKATILLHVSHSIDLIAIPDNQGYMEAPELSRLTQLLSLPDLRSVLEYFDEFSPGKSTFKGLVSGWLDQMCEYITKPAQQIAGHGLSFQIKLLHPGPLELIGLPKFFDHLTELAQRARCRTDPRKDITDPALCLFCGEIFCGQAVCCTVDKIGGCNRHVEKCGASVGIFLLIRKCIVIFLHVARVPNRGSAVAGGDPRRFIPHPSLPGMLLATPGPAPTTLSDGSFFPAPYLTKHGETDAGLRSRQQLILSQKRYDKLIREVWLCIGGSAGAGIWSAVARRLESEVSAGGWETL